MPQEESGDGDGAAVGVASENAELVNAGENPNQMVYSIFLITSWILAFSRIIYTISPPVIEVA